MNSLPLFTQILIGFASGVIAIVSCLQAGRAWRRWKQFRFVRNLMRENRARYDQRCRIKAKILSIGQVMEFTNVLGTPTGQFAFCECWQFDISNGAFLYSIDSAGVRRSFGYTKAEAIYIAEHASEFVDA